MSADYEWRMWAKPNPDDPDGLYLKPHYVWGEMWAKIGPLTFWAEMSHNEHLMALDQESLDVYEATADYRRRKPWRYTLVKQAREAR